MTDILRALAAPFPPERISWRVGSTTGDKKKGMALAYIDARDVQDRLDEVFGLNWQVRTPWCVNGRIACEIGAKIGEEWIWRGDGAGETDVEADKGAFSDAFKRAAVRWGIGRYLYDVDSPWVELEPAGKSFKIASHEYARLRKALEGKSGAPAKPAATQAVKPAAPTFDVEAEAKRVKAALDQAKNIFELDRAMEDNRDALKKLPQVTYDFLGKHFEKRRTAMERAA